MQNPEVIELLQRAMVVLIMTSAPTVVAAAVVGLVLALVQAATQLQDQSVAQALKLGAVLVVLVLSGGWMSAEVLRFADRLLTDLPGLTK
jgi:type III secretion protein S